MQQGGEPWNQGRVRPSCLLLVQGHQQGSTRLIRLTCVKRLLKYDAVLVS